MGYRNREKEIKMSVVGTDDRNAVDHAVRALFKDEIVDTVQARSKDIYWHCPGNRTDRFIRVRFMAGSGGKGQLTVKVTDRGDIKDRIEIDVPVDDAEKCVQLLTLALGENNGTVEKYYSVLFLDKDDHDNNISVYRVTGDTTVFVEVEARRSAQVDSVVKKLTDQLSYKLEREERSIYDIFIAKKAKKG